MQTEKAIEFFCRERGVSIEDLVGASLTDRVSQTRYMLYVYLRQYNGLSTRDMAEIFKRSRRNVIRGIMLFKTSYQHEKTFKRTFLDIVKKIESADESTTSKD